ncbi:GAF domain-containing sensor histidine kinase [Zunongwangia sp. F363]|uniref:histidine kinase n=1 Tax=Autumnicola tepida TaxID=3075595 RepID=A0ABU3CEV4_9FLAO|nr:GAF domain-containing sensor histidine kinase [Zunongwangia sp. F363]MDT0644757.1 GAF domain-containing sensor histidine kinase [Zunongwangia sp. F363]
MSPNKNYDSSTQDDLLKDVENINQIPIITSLLDVICSTTGMGFAAIARVTEDRWVTCTTKDEVSFGLKPGDELKIETTFCDQVRQNNEAIIIDHVAEDDRYRSHPIPAMYGFQSYISVPIHRKDNSFFGTLCALDLNPAKVSSPEIVEMFKLFADLIAFHLNTLEELKITSAELSLQKEIAEVREKFIAILGHDLKNPLGTIRMCSDMLLLIAKEEKAKQYAGTIKSTSYRMEALIENLLDFARGHLGDGIKLQKKKDKESLKNVLEQVLKEIRAMAPDAHINTTFKLEKAVECDESRVAQLFSNLLGNAVTHGSKDKPIEVKAICENGEFELSVTNAAEQIPEEVMKHLFQPFYRADIREGHQGLGLGLYISSEIAKAHDGELKVASNREKTSFTFYMPSN